MLYLKCASRVGDGLAYVSGGHVALYFDFGYNGLCKLWGYLFAAEFYSNWITVSLSIEKVCTALLCPLLALYCTVHVRHLTADRYILVSEKETLDNCLKGWER